MPYFRKKPVVIEARQATGTPDSNREIIDWTRDSKTPAHMDRRVTSYDDGSLLVDDVPSLTINTLEGAMWVDDGDWIIKGVQGEFYPCKADIFAKTYEPVDDSPAYVGTNGTTDFKNEMLTFNGLPVDLGVLIPLDLGEDRIWRPIEKMTIEIGPNLFGEAFQKLAGIDEPQDNTAAEAEAAMLDRFNQVTGRTE